MKYIIERGNEVIVEADSKDELLDKLDDLYDFKAEQTDEEIVELDGIKVKKSYYDKVMAERQKEKEDEFNRDFFPTHLGYVRRKCYMAGTGETKDFLTDILQQLPVGFEIIVYNFMATTQTRARVDEEFIAECKQRLALDFYPKDEEQ